MFKSRKNTYGDGYQSIFGDSVQGQIPFEESSGAEPPQSDTGESDPSDGFAVSGGASVPGQEQVSDSGQMPRQGTGSMESRNLTDTVWVYPNLGIRPGAEPGTIVSGETQFTYEQVEGITPNSIRAKRFDLLPAFLYKGYVAKEVDSFLHDTATKLAMVETGQISAERLIRGNSAVIFPLKRFGERYSVDEVDSFIDLINARISTYIGMAKG